MYQVYIPEKIQFENFNIDVTMNILEHMDA